jgi:hypothetical protein
MRSGTSAPARRTLWFGADRITAYGAAGVMATTGAGCATACGAKACAAAAAATKNETGIENSPENTLAPASWSQHAATR